MSKKVPQPYPRRWRNHPRQKRSPRRPTLRFSPTAWAKLLFLRDRGPIEVGGFGITSPDDLLKVQDIAIVGQSGTELFVAFDDLAVADFFEEQVDQERHPEQFARIWIHTHPGESAEPSFVDHKTFARVFGPCDWAVMFIIARGGECFAELHWKQGGPASIPLNVEVDYSASFLASDEALWATEYDANVRAECPLLNLQDLEFGRAIFEEERAEGPDRQDSIAHQSSMHSCPLAWEMA